MICQTYHLHLSDLLEDALDLDELDSLFNEAKENGYILHEGEEYFDTFEGSNGYPYTVEILYKITKTMVAYMYCVKNNILPTCDYWESGDSIQYKY